MTIIKQGSQCVKLRKKEAHESKPSRFLNFLSIFQPLHLHIFIGNLNCKLYLMSFGHLVGRVQLFQESCSFRAENEILNVFKGLNKVTDVLTFAFLLLLLHLLQSLQHSSKVSDAVLESNLFVFCGRSAAEDAPNVHVRLSVHVHSSDGQTARIKVS